MIKFVLTCQRELWDFLNFRNERLLDEFLPRVESAFLNFERSKLVIDRPSWSGYVTLYENSSINSKLEKIVEGKPIRCCLGFLALHLGCSSKQIRDHDFYSTVIESTNSSFLNSFLNTVRYILPPLGEKEYILANINDTTVNFDNASTVYKEELDKIKQQVLDKKEQLLTFIFNEIFNIELVFEGDVTW